jgi:archaeosine-15-forming tRNA-guanine transglycosylase
MGRAVFRAFLELRPNDNLVVVLGEVQYLATGQAWLLEMALGLNAVLEGRISLPA